MYKIHGLRVWAIPVSSVYCGEKKTCLQEDPVITEGYTNYITNVVFCTYTIKITPAIITIFELQL